MKKYRIKKKNFIIFLLIIFIFIINFINPLKVINMNKLKKLNYSDESSELIIKYGIKNDVIKYTYNKFIDRYINNDNFNRNYIDNYVKLSNIHDDIDIRNVNKLIELGYSDDVVEKLTKSGDNSDLLKFIDNQYTKDFVIKKLNNSDKIFINNCYDKGYSLDDINSILNSGDENRIKELLIKLKYYNLKDYLNFDSFRLKYVDNYIEYSLLNVCTIEESIISVNMGLDRDPYSDYSIVNSFSFDMLVNKYSKLKDDYYPVNLVNVPKEYSYGDNKANKDLVNSFIEMANDIKNEINLNILISDGFRTNEYQTKTFNDWVKDYGMESALKYVAKPGFSEHETSLAINVLYDKNNEDILYNWFINNAYKYGFITRYTKKNEYITGFREEKGHLRYVGDIAKFIHDENITLEEYSARYSK